jgi:nascent polypeptide-associated complex subunit alpha
MPGMPRNPAQMRLMMKRLGMTTENVDDVEEVIIRTTKEEHVFEKPEVTVLTVQGVRTYQVVGKSTVRSRTGSEAPGSRSPAATAEPAGPNEEDVALVMDQAHVTREQAIAALEEVGGAPAEAILRLFSRADTSSRET